MVESDKQQTSCGFITMLGAPNAGKSTLVNGLVGSKVSIVTPKIQTTRARVRGVAMHGACQLIYVDTPGIFKPKRKLDRSMVAAAWEGAEDSDCRAVIVDAKAWHDAAFASGKELAIGRRSREDSEAIIERFKQEGRSAVLVLNKIDQMSRDKLLPIVEELNSLGNFAKTFLVSAAKNYGLKELQAYFVEQARPGPFLYPEDQLSDITDRLLAAEITREKLFLRLHQEVPYALTVETEKWERTKKGDLRLEQTIYVERDGQKKLVLGRQGQTIKTVGQAAREELGDLFDCPVHLFLFVKVRENWQNDPARYREMGLDIAD